MRISVWTIACPAVMFVSQVVKRLGEKMMPVTGSQLARILFSAAFVVQPLDFLEAHTVAFSIAKARSWHGRRGTGVPPVFNHRQDADATSFPPVCTNHRQDADATM